MKARAQELLSRGVSQEETAKALGVSPSLISQYMADETFASAVASARIARAQGAIARAEAIDSLEDAIIEKMKSIIPWMTNPAQILAAFKIINGAKREQTQHTSAPPQQVVNVVIPEMLVPHFRLNSRNEIVEVDNRTLVTMPVNKLQAELKVRNANKLTDEI